MAGSRPRVRPRRTVEQVAAALRSAGGEPQLFPTRGPGDGVARGEEAARQFSLVAAMGGDGTVNEVLNGVVAAGAGAQLLLLPAGTVNVLARDLGLPLDACRAAALLSQGAPRRVFLGRAEPRFPDRGGPRFPGRGGPRYFALMASAGVDAAIVHRLAGARIKRAMGPFAYIVEGIRHTATYGFPRLTVRTEERELDGYMAVIGNGAGYGGWFSLTPGADTGRPGFQVAVCTSAFALKYYFFLGLALVRRIERSRDFVYLNSSRVSLSAETPVSVQLDGEPYGSLPMDFVSDGTSLEVLGPGGPLPPPSEAEASAAGSRAAL